MERLVGRNINEENIIALMLESTRTWKIITDKISTIIARMEENMSVVEAQERARGVEP